MNMPTVWHDCRFITVIPFDRLMVAQALQENLYLVSADSALDAYGVRRLW